MRAPATFLAAAAVAVSVGAQPCVAWASETVTATVTASAQLNSRTSLHVSSKVLRFHVRTPDQPAEAAVEFVAGVRTRSDAQVILTVEPVRDIGGLSAAAGGSVAVSFAGDGYGTLAGVVDSSYPAVAGCWMGSGRRTGRLVFSLRSAVPGAYAIPIRFVLSAP